MIRPRFTVRRLMVCVAIMAVIFGLMIQAVRLRRLSASYEAEAAQAVFREAVALQMVTVEEGTEKIHLENLRGAREELAKPMYQRPEWKEFLNGPDPLSLKFHEAEARGASHRIAFQKSVAAYWLARKRRYQRAARYPWLPIMPDPPEPTDVRP